MQQNENKQQRALSQSGRQHMVVKLVVLARSELILLKPAKGSHAFILYFQQERKGVSAYLAFEHMFSIILFLSSLFSF